MGKKNNNKNRFIIWREAISVQQLSLTPIKHKSKNNNQRFFTLVVVIINYII